VIAASSDLTVVAHWAIVAALHPRDPRQTATHARDRRLAVALARHRVAAVHVRSDLTAVAHQVASTLDRCYVIVMLVS
jgi:hypothetical protein